MKRCRSLGVSVLVLVALAAAGQSIADDAKGDKRKVNDENKRLLELVKLALPSDPGLGEELRLLVGSPADQDTKVMEDYIGDQTRVITALRSRIAFLEKSNAALEDKILKNRQRIAVLEKKPSGQVAGPTSDEGAGESDDGKGPARKATETATVIIRNNCAGMVDFTINGQLKGCGPGGPYSFLVDVPKGAKKITFQIAGNPQLQEFALNADNTTRIDVNPRLLPILIPAPNGTMIRAFKPVITQPPAK